MSTFTVNCLDSKAHFETVSFDNIEYNSVNDYVLKTLVRKKETPKPKWFVQNMTPVYFEEC